MRKNRLQPSVISRRKYNRIYMTHSGKAVVRNDELYRRCWLHRAVMQRKFGIYNCVWRRWVMGKLL